GPPRRRPGPIPEPLLTHCARWLHQGWIPACAGKARWGYWTGCSKVPHPYATTLCRAEKALALRRLAPYTVPASGALRLSVRTAPFHGAERGSIPLGRTTLPAVRGPGD